MALTPKQERFVAEYLVDLNATQAAIRAGYSEKTAEVIGYENLRKPQISREIAKRQKKLQSQLEITQKRVLEELAAIAFASGVDFVEVAGNGYVRIIPTEDLPDDKRRAVASYKEGQFGTEVKTYDKVRALELLGKHLGVFDNGSGAASAPENNIFEVISESTREELDTSGIPEIEPPAEHGHDMVE